jgi:DNA-binding NtrC family response regulator
MSTSEVLDEGDFDLPGREGGAPRLPAPGAPPGEDAGEAAVNAPEDLNLKRATDALERRLIQRALERAGGNRAEAARLLGIGRPNLYAKMRELGLLPP